jgi:hypothetical protein
VSVGYGLHVRGSADVSTGTFWVSLVEECLKNRHHACPATFRFEEYPTVAVAAEIDLDGQSELPHLPDRRSYERAVAWLNELLAEDAQEAEEQWVGANAAYAADQAAGGYNLNWPGPSPLERIQSAQNSCTATIDSAHAAALKVHEYLHMQGRPALGEARAELLREVGEEHERRERVRATTLMLTGLSQLFIAV